MSKLPDVFAFFKNPHNLEAITPPWMGFRVLESIEVESIDAIEKALKGSNVVVPRRKTFYGSTEIGVKDAGGNVVLFAEMS